MNEYFESSFPKKLSQKETRALFFQYKLENDLEAREKLIVHNTRLVVYLVNQKFSNILPEDKKDFISIGMIGLIKAVDSFDLSKNFSFTTYASRCIMNEILMFVRKNNKNNEIESLDKVLRVDDNDELTFGDLNLTLLFQENDLDVESIVERKELILELNKILDNFSEKEKKIIQLYFGLNLDKKQYPQREIAKLVGLSPSHISRVIRKITKKLNVIINNKQNYNIDFKQKEIKKIMPKKLQSIYVYLEKYGYDRNTVDEALNSLNEKDKEVVRLRYGDDLDNPVCSMDWNTDLNTRFYSVILVKIKNRCKKIKENNENLVELKKSVSKREMKPVIEETKQTVQKEEKVETKNTITKEEYLQILQTLKTPTYLSLMEEFSDEEKMIITLKLSEHAFSTEMIAQILNIEPKTVVEITRRFLLAYKTEINKQIDDMLLYQEKAFVNTKKKVKE